MRHAEEGECEATGCQLRIELAIGEDDRVVEAWFDADGFEVCEGLASICMQWLEAGTGEPTTSADGLEIGSLSIDQGGGHHKLFGPTGIGVLWGRRELLESIPPYQGGGDMIESVAFTKTTFAPLPHRFEAGTPDIAGAIGLGAAIDYLQNIGFERSAEHERELLDYAVDALRGVAGLRVVGNPRHRMSAISFVLEEPAIAPLDIASWLSRRGIAIRTGHHCCMPLMEVLGVPGTSRASLAMYNSRSDIDALVTTLKELVEDRRVKQSARQAEGSSDSTDQEIEIEFGAPLALPSRKWQMIWPRNFCCSMIGRARPRC